MTRRKLLIALVTAGLYALLTTVASAELHRVQVTLVTGQVLTVTIDVPPGTPVSQIEIPGLPAPVQSITDLGPVATPTPVPTPELPVPTPELPSVPTPSAPSPGGGGGGGGGGSDRPTGSDEGSKGGDSGGGGNGGGGGSSSPAPVKTPRAGGALKPPKTGNHTVDSNSEALIGRVERAKTPDPNNPTVNTDGSPSLENPTISLSQPGPARIGVPNFFIEKFRIPPFLLPIYQAAGIQYGVRWEVLAAINEIETDYGRNLNVSSAGALGWMQFMPATWKLYGVDANKDGYKDPYNPADAIFAAARYLRAAGASQDLHKAIFAYNHAEWYVDSVLLRARVIGGLPAGLVGSLTGLTQGRFPVLADATYANSVSKKQLRKQGKKAPAYEIKSNARRNGIKIFARQGAPVIAVNDGKVVRIGRSKRLGRFVTIQDVYGNVYTYGRLKKVARVYPTPKPRNVSEQDIRRELNLDRTSKDRKPTTPASKTTAASAEARQNAEKVAKRAAAARTKDDGKREAAAAQREKVAKQRLFANPARPASRAAGGDQQIFDRTGEIEGYSSFKDYLKQVFGLDRKDVALKKLRPGAQVAAGTILGRVGKTTSAKAPHMLFEIRPAGRGAPRIDPKPILDGWKLLESTAIYRAAGKNPFFGPDAKNPSIGQILLMSKEALSARVLSDPRIQIYGCGRHDVQTGQIDRRVLATLEFLSASGFKPTVTSLKCGHSFLTASGNVSEHTTGTAVDIAAINGVPITGNQGKGSITELVIQRLLTLQGTMKPHQIISLMTFDATDNTFAMADHNDHIHVGWRPLYGANSKLSKQVDQVLRPGQWIKLIDRLGDIDNPVVREQPSKYAVKSVERASDSHRGE